MIFPTDWRLNVKRKVFTEVSQHLPQHFPTPFPKKKKSARNLATTGQFTSPFLFFGEVSQRIGASMARVWVCKPNH